MTEANQPESTRTCAELPAVMPEWAAAHSLHYQFLANQQLMLEDAERTGLYHAGIVGNRSDFEGKVVLDVGAGTGILSLFAAQAGAAKVYAVEGTSAAEYARTLADNSCHRGCIEVIHARLNEIELPTKVDVIISEPWGFFLFHERMIEAFVEARDRFLAPGGRVFPSSARLYLAPFSDDELYEWRREKLGFWNNANFWGVDLTALAATAERELFEMPALGEFSPQCLVSAPEGYDFDFLSLPMKDLAKIELPFEFIVERDGPVHGLGGWFDVAFAGSQRQVVLSTSPHEPCTHWAQMRFLFRSPIHLRKGAKLVGKLTMTANRQSSYDVTVAVKTLGGVTHPTQSFRLQSYYSWQSSE